MRLLLNLAYIKTIRNNISSDLVLQGLQSMTSNDCLRRAVFILANGYNIGIMVQYILRLHFISLIGYAFCQNLEAIFQQFFFITVYALHSALEPFSYYFNGEYVSYYLDDLVQVCLFMSPCSFAGDVFMQLILS